MWEEVECKNCSGDGEIICDRCGGTGSLPGFATFGGGFTPCDVCRGSGYVECTECDGNGYTEEWVDDEEEDEYWIEEKNERQEKEKQKQQEILKLREFVFNLKIQMEDIYQSNKLSVEKKYLQSRDICQSLAINYLNPNNFETFDDKDYAVSVKGYLFNTRDELFESLSNDKKSITRILESKEKKLKEMLNRNIEKPNVPTAPILDKSGLKKKLEKPIKPIGYYIVSEERKRKDLSYDKVNKEYYPPYASLWVVIAFLIGGIPSLILAPFFPDERTGVIENIFIFLLFVPGIVLVLYYLWYITQLSKEYKIRKKIYKYEDALSEYLRHEVYNKKHLKEYETKLQNYQENHKVTFQKYQEELNKYQNYQDDINILEQEIVSLYQSFNRSRE